MRIVFMGTPEFASHSLQRLLESDHEVVGVVTVPDRPSGRGRKYTPSPVKVLAEKHGLQVLQPEDLRDERFLQNLGDLAPDLQVVVAFRILPKEVWGLPPKGTINLHASYLPYYRGAAPINRAIMNGDRETGVTTFLLNKGVDTGRILLRKKVPIGEKENAGALHDRLMEKGSELLLESIDGLDKDIITPFEQEKIDDPSRKKAPKIFREDREVHWDSTSRTIHDQIRGLSPYPAAITKLDLGENGMMDMKIFEADIGSETSSVGEPGEVLSVADGGIEVATGEGTVVVKELQPAGKKRMTVSEFLRGNRIRSGMVFR